MKSIFLSFILLSVSAVSFAQTAELHCYFRNDIANYNLGVGYFTGEGRIYCDDGSSVAAEFSGWNVMSVGITRAKLHDGSYVKFKGAKRIQDIDGRYHGGGFQLSVPMVFYFDASYYSNGEVSLEWVSPAEGIAIGFPYKTVEVRFIGEVQEPTEVYTNMLDVMGDIKIFTRKEVNPFTEETSDVLALQLDNAALEERGFHFSYKLEENGWFWNKDIVSGSFFVSNSFVKEFYIIGDLSRLGIQFSKVYTLTVAYQKDLPPVAYQYELRIPAGLGTFEIHPIKKSRVRKLKPLL